MSHMQICNAGTIKINELKKQNESILGVTIFHVDNLIFHEYIILLISQAFLSNLMNLSDILCAKVVYIIRLFKI